MDSRLKTSTFFCTSLPLVPIIIFFILGIIAASYNLLSDEISFPILIVVMLISIIGIIRRWRYDFILIGIIFFFLGILLACTQTIPNLPAHHIKFIVEQDAVSHTFSDELGMRVEGIVYSAPEQFPDRTRLYVNAERIFTKDKIIPVTGNILLTVGSAPAKVKYGDKIRFLAKLRIPKNFGNPGEFDHAGNLAREGIYVTGHVENERWIAVFGNENKDLSIEAARNRIRDFIDGSGAENHAVIKALILGEKGEISKHIRDSFAGTGTAHILVIAGLHIGIVAFVSYWFALRLLKLSERLMLAFNIKKIAAASSIITVLLYGRVAGFSMSTQRSVIMALVFIIAVLTDREKGFYNTLAAAAFVILVISPLAVYDISFQLSFVSVLAIIYLAPKLQGLWTNKNTSLEQSLTPPPHARARKLFQSCLLGPLAVSVAASIGTAPFIAWHFHRVSIIGVLANIIAVPLMCFIAVPLGLVSSFVLFFYPPFAGLILKLSDIILKISLWIVDAFAMLPYASVYTTTPTILEIVLFYLLIICVVEFRRARFFKYSIVVVILALALDYSYWYYSLNYNPNLKVTFISVGQGDAALVEFPYGKRMLIDGGGSYNDDFDTGERLIAPFLWKNKIKKIDYIILSHPQADHMKGLKFIAEKFHTEEFRWNGEAAKSKAYVELMDALKKNDTKRIIANASHPILNINGAEIQFLNPPQDSHLDTNNNTLAVRLSYKNVSFLFTGDIEAIGEMVLLHQGKKIGADVLKVAHHGSRTSSTIDFLKAVKPKLAVISVGYANAFGFPRPEILKRYEELKIPVLRTDMNGAITVETNGIDIKTFTFR